jgi:hypothetical protein
MSAAIPYWHLWTEADGASHQTRCPMSEFECAPVQREAAP